MIKKPKMEPAKDHSESIVCPHCGEEFGIEDKVDYERQNGVDYCYKEMLGQLSECAYVIDDFENRAIWLLKDKPKQFTPQYVILTWKDWQALQGLEEG